MEPCNVFISFAALPILKNVFKLCVPNLTKSVVSFNIMPPNIAKPGPDKTFPMPSTIDLANLEPNPSPSKRP